MTPDQYCHDLLKGRHLSLAAACLCLPKVKRKAIYALYAFCTAIQEVVNKIEDHSVAKAKLEWWHSEIDTLYTSSPNHPITEALFPAISHFDLKKSVFIEFLDEQIAGLNRASFPDFNSLSGHCDQIAGAIGVSAAQIFGFSDPQTLNAAKKLNLSTQLISIIQNVGTDALNGKIYLPVDEQIRFGVYTPDILRLKSSPELQKLLALYAERARSLYQEALQTLPPVDHIKQRHGLAIASIYLDLLNVIEKNGFDTLNQTYSLTMPRQAFCVLKTHIKALLTS